MVKSPQVPSLLKEGMVSSIIVAARATVDDMNPALAHSKGYSHNSQSLGSSR